MFGVRGGEEEEEEEGGRKRDQKGRERGVGVMVGWRVWCVRILKR